MIQEELEAIAAKHSMSESETSQTQLANALNIDEKEVRRILDPHHGTKLATLERTLNVLGKKAVLSVWNH